MLTLELFNSCSDLASKVLVRLMLVRVESLEWKLLESHVFPFDVWNNVQDKLFIKVHL
jgi:hypothetical protein